MQGTHPLAELPQQHLRIAAGGHRPTHVDLRADSGRVCKNPLVSRDAVDLSAKFFGFVVKQDLQAVWLYSFCKALSLRSKKGTGFLRARDWRLHNKLADACLLRGAAKLFSDFIQRLLRKEMGRRHGDIQFSAQRQNLCNLPGRHEGNLFGRLPVQGQTGFNLPASDSGQHAQKGLDISCPVGPHAVHLHAKSHPYSLHRSVFSSKGAASPICRTRCLSFVVCLS